MPFAQQFQRTGVIHRRVGPAFHHKAHSYPQLKKQRLLSVYLHKHAAKREIMAYLSYTHEAGEPEVAFARVKRVGIPFTPPTHYPRDSLGREDFKRSAAAFV